MASSRKTPCAFSSSSKAKRIKRQASIETFLKWQRSYEREHHTLTWLRADTDEKDRKMISTLWCEVCRRYEGRLSRKKNFSKAWIDGSTNHRTSNITDHACSEQHKSAMALLCRDQARSKREPITTYSPIARSLLSTVLSPAVSDQMKKKFEISFLPAKEHIPFTKYSAIHDLEERHGVDLGSTYKNRDSAPNFIHFIAESQRQCLYATLGSTNFYSVLMDSSTDKGRIEDVILFCERNEELMEMRTTARYYCVMEPQKTDADGLVDSLGIALKGMGIDDLFDSETVLGIEGFPVLVGCGTHGASVNVAEQNGMKGKFQAALPWLHWAWCYTHRLELVCRDAFSSRLFHDIDEMLLRLYYLYEKSPKKSKDYG